MTVIERAPAKVNLYLDVLGKRSDGFHEIKTVMQEISLADELVFEFVEGRAGESLSVIGDPSIPTDGRNLVLRAVEAYRKRSAIDGFLGITLKKSIPSAAGLGGGSSDAAAALRALNKLSPNPLSQSDLLEIAAELGSDVPFFLGSGAAICSGRGEIIEPIEPIKNLYSVIVKTDEAVSTPEAYRALDELFCDFLSPRSDDGREASYKSVLSGNADFLYNVFEPAILPACKRAAEAKKMMLRLGAVSAIMSGSGPSILGVFSSRELALEAAKKLDGNFDFVACAE